MFASRPISTQWTTKRLPMRCNSFRPKKHDGTDAAANLALACCLPDQSRELEELYVLAQKWVTLFGSTMFPYLRSDFAMSLKTLLQQREKLFH